MRYCPSNKQLLKIFFVISVIVSIALLLIQYSLQTSYRIATLQPDKISPNSKEIPLSTKQTLFEGGAYAFLALGAQANQVWNKKIIMGIFIHLIRKIEFSL